MRGALKEPAKVKALAQEAFSYNSASWSAGEQGPKTAMGALKEVGKK